MIMFFVSSLNYVIQTTSLDSKVKGVYATLTVYKKMPGRPTIQTKVFKPYDVVVDDWIITGVLILGFFIFYF